MDRFHFILLGPPGAGKGTQAKLLANQFHLVHLSTGDLLRAEVQAGTQLGKKVQAIMERGELVDDATILAIIEQKLHQYREVPGILYDGFPRTVPQAEGLERLLQTFGEEVTASILLEVPFEELKARILKRATKENRSDDTEETIETRFHEYIDKTSPLISYYSDRNRLFKVSGVGSIEEISSRLSELIKGILA